MWFWSYLAVDESRVGAPAPNNNENNENEKQRIPDGPPGNASREQIRRSGPSLRQVPRVPRFYTMKIWIYPNI